MNISDAKSVILELATEDFYGLWEIQWHLESLLPDYSATEVLTLSMAASIELVSQSFIEVYVGKMKNNLLRPLSESDAIYALRQSDYWNQPDDTHDQYCIASTQQGDDAYMRQSLKH